ncbi:MAG: FAD-dependent oxidoreductase [Kiritimatiellae bacterium]|jgi:NAD(P)H-nitrite reductase large subunit|nr:FAD-dependent oxidoreductase [Kiritimatiellia bacterium]MDD4342387.1 FAD-dependent oxidoreductase [Kiritimatiellia bacterium]MDY0148468.1 FAD-dependent oxidoreductase [Kiritimatiellia bacterium]
MTYVIIGASAAGAQAAEDLRKLDPDGDIRILTEEAGPPYSRCLISRYADGRLQERDLYFKTDHFAADHRIHYSSGVRVTSIRPGSNTVICDNGETVVYDKLLLATGSRPWLPAIPGCDLEGVCTFHSLKDAQAITAQTSPTQTVAIIGAGFAGLEAAYALARKRLKVTVVERCGQILPNQLDAQGATIIHRDLERMGVQIILNQSVAAINGSDRATGVMLAEKPQVQADFVIVATGTEPNKGLAAQAGLETARGIRVSNRLQTSAPHIFAAGDAIEIDDVSTGKRMPSATWFNAVLQGKYAAYNMAGRTRPYTGAVGIQNAVQFHQIPAISLGQVLVDSDSRENVEVVSLSEGDAIYKKLVLKDGRIVGMVFVGDIQKSGFYGALIRDQVDVSRFRHKLLDKDFSYAAVHRGPQFGQRSPYQ